MMLANSRLRVSLVTVHVPLKRVPQVLTQASILRTVQHTFDFLRRMNPAKQSRIAVLALNPHAGEAGLLGTEEKTVITPAIRKAQKIYGKKALIQGPFPADSFFAKHTSDFDAVVAMYHDQGLIPVKLIDFNATVNVTLGLPIIRTSVDHGTAFDIVGKGVASHASLEAAIELARKICQKA
jgi:4-hydroxythreonine-4-phosphate dehydrogenase